MIPRKNWNIEAFNPKKPGRCLFMLSDLSPPLKTCVNKVRRSGRPIEAIPNPTQKKPEPGSMLKPKIIRTITAGVSKLLLRLSVIFHLET